jgi:hypothetical protein
MATLKRIPARAILRYGYITVEVQRLGAGRYTTAWRDVLNPEMVYLQVSEKDFSKEMLTFMQDYKHIPQLEQLESFDNDSRLYRTKFYRKLTAKHTEAWETYKILATCIEQAKCDTPFNSPPHVYNQLFDDAVQDKVYLSNEIKETIHALVDWCQSYGEYCIEICPKNLAVDDDGTLVLLDPCFDQKEVKESYKKALDKSRKY